MPSEDYIWSPLSLTEVVNLFRNLPIPWWVAGGTALDLFVGFQIRPHADIDVGIFRRDQLIIQDHLQGWNLHKTGPSGLRPWLKGEYLQLGANQVWCRRTPDAHWSLEIMFMEQEGDEWLFRREPQVRGSIQGLIRRTENGIPYLSPEVQLLFKSRSEIPDKDSLDFRAVLPHLDGTQIEWLHRALEATFPAGHSWIDILRPKGEST